MLVKEKMKNKYLVSIKKLTEIEKYQKVGVTAFCFALDNYAIGYETFSIEQINNAQGNKYVLINRLLSSSDIDKIKEILPLINCQGFIIEDIGLIKLIKNLNKEIILFINHFNCNYVSINEWLEYVDSVFVSNELTYDEIVTITKNVKKPIVLHLFGHNQVMYSRRLLLSNYYDKFNYPKKNNQVIKDKMGNLEFIMHESKYGTIGYTKTIFDGKRLLGLDNVYYYFLNTTYVDVDDTIKYINGEKIENTDEGFLDKPTVFRISDMK